MATIEGRNQHQIDFLDKKISELECRISTYNALIKDKDITILTLKEHINDKDQKFVDMTAIAAMSSIISSTIAAGIDDEYRNVPDSKLVSDLAFEYANALLAEKKRLHGLDHENL